MTAQITQHLNPQLTTWHIVWGTYGARLHGDDRPSVDKSHNQPGEPYVEPHEDRLQSARGRMRHEPVSLTREQRRFIESIIPTIAQRGGWALRTCAAGPDHVHVVLDIDPRVHGEKARRLLKRWIGQELSTRWPRSEESSWWAEEGSNTAIHDEQYLNNAFDYVFRQRVS